VGITRYKQRLDFQLGVILSVYFKAHGSAVLSYSLVLLAELDGRIETIRVYDSSHGFNEMHRYTREGGKQNGVVVNRATLGEGMRAAMEDIKDRYLAMIEGWEEWR
jgi:hypothetical protein